MALSKFYCLQMLLIPNFILLFSFLSRSYGKHIHSDIGRMRLEIANLPENQNDIPELSASVVHQQVVSGPPGHNSFPDSESSTSVVLQHVVTGPPAHGSFLAQESSTSVIPEQSVTGPPAHGSFLAQESSTSVIPEQAVNGPPTHGSSPAQESSTSVIPEQAVTGSPGRGSSPAQESSTSVIPEQAVNGPPTHGSSPAQESSTSVIPEQAVTGPPTHGSSPAQESSTSVIPEQAVTGSPGRGSFPANFSLYLLSYMYPLQNISELKIIRPYVEMYWEEFSRSNSSTVPVSQEDFKSTSKIRPAHAKYPLTHPISQEDSESSSQTRPNYSLKFHKNTPSTKINSLIFPESFSVTKDSRFSPNPSQGNKITDTPSKEGFEMAEDSLHMNETHMNETGNHNIKIQPEGTSEDGGSTNSQRDAALTETTYRDGRTMFFITEMECRYECHERSINSSDPDCFVNIECCGDHYCGEDYLKCLQGNLTKTNRNQSDNPNCHNATI